MSTETAAEQEARFILDEKEAAGPSKDERILDACRLRDLELLKDLAEQEGGFLNDDLRRLAWPILLGTDATTEDGVEMEEGPWTKLPRHQDEDQVQLDVNRAFIYYPNDLSEAQLEQRKAELSSLITEVLRRHPYLCYFQGYHDICQVFLLVLEGSPHRTRLTTRLSVLRIRDFMLPSLAATVAQLRLIPDLIAAADPPLRRHVAAIQPFYALGGTLTMYAHNIEGYRDIVRLFDALLVNEPVFSVYLYARIVLDRRDELLDTPADDTAMLHYILSKLPKRLDLEALIADTRVLFERYPPEMLASWRRISASSCLKTARTLEGCAAQRLGTGRACFEKQATELQWAERRDRVLQLVWAYRQPAGAIGLAIAVGLVSVYLRRSPGPMHYLTTLVSRLAPA